MVELTNDQKVAQLKFYLGKFFVRIPQELQDRFKGALPGYKSIVVRGDYRFLRCFGAYYLLAFGRKQYRFAYSYELIDTYLGNVSIDEQATFSDIQSELLFLYHMVNTMENRQLEPMMCHNLTQRSLEGKKTVLLLEGELSMVQGVARTLGFAELGQNAGGVINRREL